MKTVSRHILWPVMLIVLSSVPAQAVNGFYYPTPSWDQKLPGSARFVVLSDWNNEAVLDRETGLVWQKAPDAFKTSWTLNDQFCNINNPSRGNRFGWRLPTSSELTSLIEWQNGVVGSFIILPPRSSIRSAVGSRGSILDVRPISFESGSDRNGRGQWPLFDRRHPGRVGARTRLVRSWWPLADHGPVIGCLIADNSQPLARAGEVAQEVLHWRAECDGACYLTGCSNWWAEEGSNL